MQRDLHELTKRILARIPHDSHVTLFSIWSEVATPWAGDRLVDGRWVRVVQRLEAINHAA